MSTPNEQLPRPVFAAIQDTVHLMDIGAGQIVLRGVLLMAAAIMLLLIYAGSQFRGVRFAEAMDQMQLGRNLMRGDGYTTRVLRPISLWQLSQRSRWKQMMLGSHPDLMNPPAYPVLAGALLYMVQKGDLWPADNPVPPRGPDDPKTARQIIVDVLAYPHLRWGLLGAVGLWITWVLQRAFRRKLRRGQLPWHALGMLLLLMLFALLWAPKTSFKVEAEEAYTIYSPERWVVYGLGIPLTLLNGWLIYLIARRLFDRRVGVTATCLFVLCETVCQYAISGLNIMLLMFWATLACLLMVIANDWRSQGQRPALSVLLALAAGMVAGCAFLTKYAGGWLLLPLALLGWRMWGLHRGAWLALGMLTAFLTVAGPWMMRNVWIASHPFGVAGYTVYEKTEPLRRTRLERMIDDKAIRDALTAVTVKRIFEKAARNAHELWTDSPWAIGSGVTTAFFLAALFYRFRRPQVNRFKWYAVGCGVVLFLVTCTAGVEPRPPDTLAQEGNLLVLLTPLMTIFGSALFYVLLERAQVFIPIWRGTIVGLFIALTAMPLVFRLAGPTPDRFAYPPYYPPKVAQAAGYLEAKEYMASDQPWAVAWYGDRRCFWLPATPEEFYKINDLYQHISALLLTPVSLNRRFYTEIMLDEWMQWAPILRFLKFPDDFPLKAGKQLEGVNMVLLCDRRRWPQ
ncbi:MAG: glycosyltransferase family 39 protein [Verrucomicrobiae bacterium]|nr:glycosyltransferase family 39 protein [Verrucomicrobiae bacterium]